MFFFPILTKVFLSKYGLKCKDAFFLNLPRLKNKDEKIKLHRLTFWLFHNLSISLALSRHLSLFRHMSDLLYRNLYADVPWSFDRGESRQQADRCCHGEHHKPLHACQRHAGGATRRQRRPHKSRVHHHALWAHQSRERKSGRGGGFWCDDSQWSSTTLWFVLPAQRAWS